MLFWHVTCISCNAWLSLQLCDKSTCSVCLLLCVTEVEEACEVAVAWVVVAALELVLVLALVQAVVLAVDLGIAADLEQEVVLVGVLAVAEDLAVEEVDLAAPGLVVMDMVTMT